MEDYDFRKLAACADEDPELFFPIGAPGAPVYEREVAKAKAVCRRCPVMVDCLWFALGNLDMTEFGIWGSTTPAEREALRRALPRTRTSAA